MKSKALPPQRDDLRSPHRLAEARSFDARIAPLLESLKLKKFESCLDCLRRQARMLDLFGKYLPQTGEWDSLAQCDAQTCGMAVCTEACHLGTMQRRITALETGLPIMAAHPGPHRSVCLVHPKWEAGVGELSQTSIGAALQWNHRRLAGLGIQGLLAMGIYEVSLNQEQDGQLHWAGEIQQIVAGANETELRKAFKIEDRYRELRPRQHMVDVRKFKSLNLKFAYAQKRLIQVRKAYPSATNGRQNRNHLPPPPEQWAEHDAWLLGLPLGARTVLFGCSRRGTTIFAKK
jgi:hypothetical protein